MSRIIFLVLVFALVIFSYFMVRGYKDTYKILPANLPNELEVPEFAGWREFTPPTKRFSVLLPVLPQHATEVVKDPVSQQDRTYNMYVSEKLNGTIFMISLIDFSKPFNPDQMDTALTNMMNDLVKTNPNNKLKYSEFATFKDQRALKFVIENNKIIIEGTTFILGNTLFVLTRISQVAQENDEEYQFFLNSFHLLNAKTEQETK